MKGTTITIIEPPNMKNCAIELPDYSELTIGRIWDDAGSERTSEPRANIKKDRKKP